MNKADLEERITRLEEKELVQKFGLEHGFKNLEAQMKPRQILKNIMKKGIMKVKAFIPKFFSPSNTRQ
jgi:hypothetical protein